MELPPGDRYATEAVGSIPSGVKADDPELFEAYRTAFDNSRFRKEQPAIYDAHMRVTTHREFEWINEVDPGTTNELPKLIGRSVSQ